MSYVLNDTGSDTCRFCLNTGWVELAGTGADGYSRGTAPCKWCQQGRLRYGRMVELKQHPASDFAPNEVVMPNLDRRPFKPDADFVREMERDFGTPREVLWGLYRRVWPPEWPKLDHAGPLKALPKTETAKDIKAQRKIEQDRLAKLEDAGVVDRYAPKQSSRQEAGGDGPSRVRPSRLSDVRGEASEPAGTTELPPDPPPIPTQPDYSDVPF